METYFWSTNTPFSEGILRMSGIIQENSPVVAYAQAINKVKEAAYKNGIVLNGEPTLDAFNKVS